MRAVFLPGIIAPARVRYAALLEHLREVDVLAKDLEVYAGDAPPDGYSIALEVEGVAAAADRAGFDRFHLYGHSGGAAVALAFAAAYPRRLLSLAVDEPAADFTDEDLSDPYWKEFDKAGELPPPDAMRAFMRLQVGPDVELPSPPPGPPPAWMGSRPAGIAAFVQALQAHHVEVASYRAVAVPVFFTSGTLSHPRWRDMDARLAKLFPDYTSVVFDGLHHLNTSHQAEPARVAELLQTLWSRAEAQAPR